MRWVFRVWFCARAVLIGVWDFGDRAARAGTGCSISWSARRFRGGRMRRGRRRGRACRSCRCDSLSRKDGVAETEVGRGECLGMCISPCCRKRVVMILVRLKRLTRWNLVSFSPCLCVVRMMLTGGRSHVAEQGSQLTELADVRTARACARELLGIASPQDMAAYALQSAADLVDLISRVCGVSFHYI